MSITDRRRRLKRPFSLTVFGFIFLSLPLVRYFQVCYEKNISYDYPLFFIQSLDTLDLILLFAPLIVAAGTLIIKPWGWYFFLAYSALLICYNLYRFFHESAIYNFSTVLFSFLGALAVIFFTSKDISAPYLRMTRRGWRRHLRRNIQVKIKVNNTRRTTRDINELGAYVKWSKCELDLSEEVDVSFSTPSIRYHIKGGIVRIDDDGIGIAFRNLGSSEQKQLRKDLQSLERNTRNAEET